MSTASIETVRDRIDASGSSCAVVAADELAEAILSAAGEPAVAAPSEPLGRALADTRIEVDPTGAALRDAHTGVTPAGAAVTASGSIVLTDLADGTGLISVFVDRHVAVVPETEILQDIDEALAMLGDGGSRSCILATGPSATADMGELVQGAHGPGSVHVIIVTEADR